MSPVQPPPPHDAHTYEIRIYALDAVLDLDTGLRLPDLEEAMDGHILGEGLLTGMYDR